MTRKHNFSAGPAVLPVSVLDELRAQILDLHGSGVGLMEISHRSQTFGDIVDSAMARIRRVLSLPDTHTVLLLQGGASTQFLMIPANLLQGGHADYLNTGTWSTKAIKEARRFGSVSVPFDGAEVGYRALPASWEDSDDVVYSHYTSNNTIHGTQFHHVPGVSGMLACDASSDIASRAMDGGRFDVLYAGAQKNLGPSGVTLVCLSERAMAAAKDADVPTMLDYRVHADKGSLFNTPNTLGIFVLERVLAWVEEQGLDALAARNERKASSLYELLDGSDFWQPHAETSCRSMMNVTWRLRDPELEAPLLAEAEEMGFSGIRGHRSVGGLRASIYNACPEDSVAALVAFLKEFERTHG
ncbi:MAG TPA: 3-phosphoserine/phosphohydroxythreonine transaminase [Myxococcota bacterium]|nr:3-phosphoserine/phosphohydroxythreonine transaminase [Myxococcota bacterium]